MIEMPPLGVMPRFILAERRVEELDAAIRRYLLAGLPTLPEWHEERNELINYLKSRRTE